MNADYDFWLCLWESHSKGFVGFELKVWLSIIRSCQHFVRRGTMPNLIFWPLENQMAETSRTVEVLSLLKLRN